MKNMIVTLVSGFMLLMISCSAAFATESEDHYYNDLLVNYGNTHQEIVVELERARKNISELMKMFQEARRLDQLLNKKNEKPEYYSKYQEQRIALEESLSEKYIVALIVPGFHFENFNIANETQIKIDKILNDTIAIYKDSLGCFNQKTYSDSKNCNSFQKVCANYGSDNGDMYFYELTKELELKKVDVSENDSDLFSSESYKGPELMLRDVYLFCRLKSKISSPFSPSSIRKNDPALDFKFIKNFYGRVLLFYLHSKKHV